jgi:hypothetical protein
VKRNGSATAGVAQLLVRTPLPNLGETTAGRMATTNSGYPPALFIGGPLEALLAQPHCIDVSIGQSPETGTLTRVSVSSAWATRP